LRGVGSTAVNEMFERVVQLFDADRDRLRLPELQVIYSVPPYLPYLTNVKQYVSVTMLASVRVCMPPAQARREPRSSGLDVMRQVLDRRFPRWRELVSQEAADLFALRSGGDIRQFLRRFLLEALDQCYFALDRLPLRPDDAIVIEVLEKHRVEFESMVTRDEHGLLHAIGQENSVAAVPERRDWTAVARFFDIRAVLNYRNGVEWLDINPLLWPLIDSYSPPNPNVVTAA
jgi:hypothetical protein